MSIYEYDEERHIRQEREDAWEEGRKEGEKFGLEKGREEGERAGREEGEQIGQEKGRLELIRKKLAKGKSIPEIAEALEEEEETIRELIAQMQGKTD